MDYGIKDSIIAVVTTNRNMTGAPNSPVFYAEDQEDSEKAALLIAKSTRGMVHQIMESTYIIVRH